MEHYDTSCSKVSSLIIMNIKMFLLLEHIYQSITRCTKCYRCYIEIWRFNKEPQFQFSCYKPNPLLKTLYSCKYFPITFLTRPFTLICTQKLLKYDQNLSHIVILYVKLFRIHKQKLKTLSIFIFGVRCLYLLSNIFIHLLTFKNDSDMTKNIPFTMKGKNKFRTILHYKRKPKQGCKDREQLEICETGIKVT